MTADDFRAALAQLGLAQRAFARLVRVNERTVRSWAAGAAVVPGTVALLLQLALLVVDKAPEADVRAWLARQAGEGQGHG